MSISSDLFLSILAMDAYNRGYDSGIGNQPNGLGGIGSQIGNATVAKTSEILVDGNNARRDVAASFYAQSYTITKAYPSTTGGAGLSVGQSVISYRGTDTDFATGADRPAFAMGAGLYGTAQGNLAIDFYKTVNGNSATTNTNITVTGHSLGGGLAGYVGSLYGLNGRLFDNMATVTNDNLASRKQAA